MNKSHHTTTLRVRYCDTDKMGTFYNARALEWFECGRTEMMRNLGLPYTQIEQRGYMLPVVEAHLEYLGRATYDDLLHVEIHGYQYGMARFRFDVEIIHDATGRPIVRGYTIHAVIDTQGKPTRPPHWLVQLLQAHPQTSDGKTSFDSNPTLPI